MHSQVVVVLVNLLISIDLAADSEIDPDFAVTLQGEAVTTFDALENADRHEIAEIVSTMVDTETVAERREALAEFAEAYGLLDDEED